MRASYCETIKEWRVELFYSIIKNHTLHIVVWPAGRSIGRVGYRLYCALQLLTYVVLEFGTLKLLHDDV